jgi:hypothetical protein
MDFKYNLDELFGILVPSLLPKALPSLQTFFTRRTIGHCLGTFTAQKLISSPPLP